MSERDDAFARGYALAAKEAAQIGVELVERLAAIHSSDPGEPRERVIAGAKAAAGAIADALSERAAGAQAMVGLHASR